MPPLGYAPKIQSIDLQNEENARQHRTTEYNRKEFVFRRGQPVLIRFECTMELVSTDTVELRIQHSSGDLYCRATDLQDDRKGNQQIWMLEKISGKRCTVHMQITAPANAAVGRYSILSAEVTRDGEKSLTELNEQLIVLFNVWCPHDVVYLSEESYREELVMNQHGRIALGPPRNNVSTPWFYGQFEPLVLDCALQLLRRATAGASAGYGWFDGRLGEAVVVSRLLAAMVNEQTETGLLTAKWNDPFTNGYRPSSWKGSVSIIRQFMATQTTVAYGQCWVFAGLFTSLMRALGLPTRCVTNIRSAQDYSGRLMVEQRYNDSTDPFLHPATDNIWSFHVWNEIWCRRTDLPSGFDGWQAIDCTPVERANQDSFILGPCSVTAIKRGRTDLIYDCRYFFSQVSAFVRKILINDTDTKTLHDAYHLGSGVYTKSPGSDNLENVLMNYKYHKNAIEEALVYANACRHARIRNEYSSDDQQRLEFQFKILDPPSTLLGGDVTTSLRATNVSKHSRTLSASLHAYTADYTGNTHVQLCFEQTIDTKISPGKFIDIPLRVHGEDYVQLLTEMDMEIKFQAVAKVQETKEFFADETSFCFEKPTIEARVNKQVTMGKPTRVKLMLENPLNVDLTDCEVRIEGPGISEEVDTCIGIIKSRSVGEFKVHITPMRIGICKFVVGFESKELHVVSGEFTMTVF